jgi:hypothetical protein
MGNKFIKPTLTRLKKSQEGAKGNIQGGCKWWPKTAAPNTYKTCYKQASSRELRIGTRTPYNKQQ